MTTSMQKAISDILFCNGLFELFQTSTNFHLRLKNEPWLARVLERHGDEVSVTHYVEQNGDLLRDPEMAFSLQTVTTAIPLFEGWVPLTTEPGGFGRVYPTVKHDANGKLAGYYPRAMKDAYAFAALWARDLRSRGFVRHYLAGEIESLTDLRELAERLALAEAPSPLPTKPSTAWAASRRIATCFRPTVPAAAKAGLPAGQSGAAARFSSSGRRRLCLQARWTGLGLR